MTTAQAIALRALFVQLGTARHRQYWSQAQTHADDYTCMVVDPTPEEITAIAALMKLPPLEDTLMSETPTPGQICYAAYQAMLPERAYFPAAAWLVVDAAHQRAWEAAAQAVLAQCTPEKDTPCDTA